MTNAQALRDTLQDGRVFQSLIASTHGLYRLKLWGAIEDSVADDPEKEYIYGCFYRMILSEKQAFDQGYHVFYRLVRTKYVLYQINTFMLRIFCDEFASTTEGEFICSPCLEADAYPTSMAHFFHLYRTKAINHDSEDAAQKFLISVNCCLTPGDKDTDFHGRNVFHSKEASPVYFTNGYEETQSWGWYLPNFLASFFEIETMEAMQLVQKIKNEYAEDHLGHCIQILIPKHSRPYLAYPCLSWGTPVAVYAARGRVPESNKYKCFPLFKETPSNQPRESNPALQAFIKQHGREYEEMDMDAILRSPCMAKIQARIIAHPLLFTRAHGVIARVFSGSPDFDSRGFVQKMSLILGPYVQKALHAGKRIRFPRPM